MFRKVSELGSVNRASQVLNISQPALSRHITRFEQDLGVKLVIRDHSGVRPTPAGQLLYDHSTALLERIDSIRRALLETDAAALSEVRLGVTPAVSNLLMGPLVSRLSSQLPKVRLKVSESTSDNLLRWVTSREIDFGVVLEPDLPGGISHLPLWRETLFLVGPVDSPFFRRPSTRIRDLAGLPFCLTGRRIGARRWIEDSFARTGTLLNVTHEMESVGSLSAFLSATGTFSIMSHSAVQTILSAGEMAGIQITDLQVKRDLVWRSDLSMGAEFSQFCAALTTTIASDLGPVDWLFPEPAAPAGTA